MRIIFMKGWAEEEKLSYKPVIANNIITSMRTLCQACVDLQVLTVTLCSAFALLPSHSLPPPPRSPGDPMLMPPPSACWPTMIS
jgi:hypothetical protein